MKEKIVKKELPSLLLAEDELGTRDVLSRFLKTDYRVIAVDNGLDAVKALDEGSFDAVLTDLRMNGVDGFGVLDAAKKKNVPCVVFTAYGSIETAVEAMRLGAYDFVTKPVNFDRLELLLQRLLEQKEMKAENRELKRRLEMVSKHPMIGHSKVMQDVTDLIRQVAPTRSTVLITGESGTGKELVAQMVHEFSGRTGAFVPVHCAALPETLLESELFGHEKGSFTGASERRAGRFESADDGTLFLDEIGEIALSVQVKLLRALETQTFERVGGSAPLKTNARIVTATNRDLLQMTREGTFREDLYFRLDVVRIHLPPLRERREDIPLLVRHFLDRFALENQKDVMGITEDALQVLSEYNWPGNIREVRNCVERMVVLSRTDLLTADHIPYNIKVPDAESSLVKKETLLLDLTRNERQCIIQALQKCDGNRTRAAEELGISRRTLHRKLHEYQIDI